MQWTTFSLLSFSLPSVYFLLFFLGENENVEQGGLQQLFPNISNLWIISLESLGDAPRFLYSKWLINTDLCYFFLLKLHIHLNSLITNSITFTSVDLFNVLHNPDSWQTFNKHCVFSSPRINELMNDYWKAMPFFEWFLEVFHLHIP